MRYQQDLQVALRDRLARLLGADYHDFGTEAQYLVDWLRKRPALTTLLDAAERAEPGLADDLVAWKKSVAAGTPAGAETEAGRAWLIWQLVQEVAEAQRSGDVRPLRGYALRYSRNVNDAVRELVRRVIKPMFDYLSDQIARDSTMIYHLERYVRRLEWFEQERLYEAYKQNTRSGEEVYDRDFRQFLFAEGVNMPYSQAKSPSGLSDVIVDVDDDDRFVGEIKIFDGDNRGKREIAKGLNQAVQYAQDLGVTTSHLVVVNLSGRVLELPSDGPVGVWPPYLDVGNVRVYVVVARGLPGPSASKQGKAQPVRVSRDDLLHPE